MDFSLADIQHIYDQTRDRNERTHYIKRKYCSDYNIMKITLNDFKSHAVNIYDNRNNEYCNFLY